MKHFENVIKKYGYTIQAPPEEKPDSKELTFSARLEALEAKLRGGKK